MRTEVAAPPARALAQSTCWRVAVRRALGADLVTAGACRHWLTPPTRAGGAYTDDAVTWYVEARARAAFAREIEDARDRCPSGVEVWLVDPQGNTRGYAVDGDPIPV